MPPLRRSALHHRLVAAGGRSAPFEGWDRVESLGDPGGEAHAVRTGVALADLSAGFLLLAQGDRLDDWLPARPLVGWLARVNGGVCCRLTEDSALLITCRPIDLQPPVNTCGHLTDLTSGRAVVAVAGPDSRALLGAVTQLDLRPGVFPDGRCAQTAVAQVAATLLRRDRQGVPAFEILVARDLGEYLWDVLLDAGAPLQARPVGAAALERGD